MLFVTLGTPKPNSTMRERVARRAEYKYPPEVKVVGEYWLELAAPTVVAILETDDPAAIMAARTDWDDHFDFTTTPAVSAERGLEMARKLIAERGRERARKMTAS